MTILVPIVVAVCILAVAYLCGYVHGHIAGSKAGRQLAEREQARAAALERIKHGDGWFAGTPAEQAGQRMTVGYTTHTGGSGALEIVPGSQRTYTR